MRVIQHIKCKFGRGDVRTVHFASNDKRVRVTCRGLPPIIVKEREDGSFVAICRVVTRQGIVREFIAGKTAERAYKRAIRIFWKDAA